MPKPNLDEVLAVKDPLLSDNFEFLIPEVPGATGPASRDLRIQLKTGIKPGMTIEDVQYELFGHTVNHAGRTTFTREMQVTFAENTEANITQAIEQWIDYVRSHTTQSGHFKADYATNGRFIIYDQEGSKVLEYIVYNVWPKDLGELSFDGAAASALETSVTFSFDYYEKA